MFFWQMRRNLSKNHDFDDDNYKTMARTCWILSKVMQLSRRTAPLASIRGYPLPPEIGARCGKKLLDEKNKLAAVFFRNQLEDLGSKAIRFC